MSKNQEKQLAHTPELAVWIEEIICEIKFWHELREAGSAVQFFPKVVCLVLSWSLLTPQV